MLPYEPEPGLNLDGTRIFIAAGGRDPLVPAAQSNELAARAERAGAEVTVELNPAAGHNLEQSDLQALATWL
jgi:predicted esterase